MSMISSLMFFFSFLFCRYKSGEETEIIREVERETTRSLFVALSFSLSIENQVCLEDIQQTRWTLLLTALLSIGSLFLHRTKRNLARTHTHTQAHEHGLYSSGRLSFDCDVHCDIDSFCWTELRSLCNKPKVWLVQHCQYWLVLRSFDHRINTRSRTRVVEILVSFFCCCFATLVVVITWLELRRKMETMAESWEPKEPVLICRLVRLHTHTKGRVRVGTFIDATFNNQWSSTIQQEWYPW